MIIQAYRNFNSGKYDALLARVLTHWGKVTHICVGKPTIIGSDNGLSPGRHQAIICTNAVIFLRTNIIEILIEIQTFSLKKIRLKMSSAEWWPFCPGLKMLMNNNILQKIIYVVTYPSPNFSQMLIKRTPWKAAIPMSSRVSRLVTSINFYLSMPKKLNPL